MDPKKMPNLDPKLKEIYDRVMNTDISSSIVTSIPAQNIPKDNNFQSGNNSTPQSALPAAPPLSNTQSNAAPAAAPVPKPVAPVTPPAQSSSLPPHSFNASPPPSSAPSSSTKTFATFNASHLKADTTSKSSPQPNQAAVAMVKGSSILVPVAIFVGGTIFFIIYALFWIKFFGVQLPFLSNFF